MKKIISTFLLLFTSLLLFSQGITTSISGTVTNSSTGLPVNNQPVYITTDSANTTFTYYNVVYTNPNGYYYDSLAIPYPSQIIFYISTADCNGSMITNTVISSTLPMTSDFTISCGGNPTVCSSAFMIYPDSVNGLGYSYYFYDQSNSGAGTITSWSWNFGDGGSSTDQDPVHVYSNIGLYNICLTISTDSGCTSTYCDSIYVDSVNTAPCQASFGYQMVNTTVDFYGYSNTSPVTYTWDFGDGSSGTGQYPSHYYASAGTYTACLTIYNNNGCYNEYCETITVGGSQGNGCPASYYVYTDTSNTGGYTYYFINTSPGANNYVANFLWYFGDGTTSTDVNPVHTYSNMGSFLVCLDVLDDSTGNILCTYCDSILVDSTNSNGCYADFGWNCSNSGYVYFNDYSGTGNYLDYITSWTWDFGDGTSSTDQNPIHYYNSGLYTVCLAITTSSGCSSTYCDYIQVNSDSLNYNCGLYVAANTITNESMPGASDGAIDIDVYGGTPPYIFSWSNGASTEDISGLTAGYYDVVVSDNSGQGCQTWASFEILDMSDSSNWSYIDTIYTNPIDSCFNFSIGYAYIYSWSFVNNTTIEITWIVYDSQGVNVGFVTTIYTISQNGNYQFSVTIICGQLKSTHVFYDDLYIMNPAAGITESTSSSEAFNIYPNPVTDAANIVLNSLSGNAEVSILNVTGQEVYKTIVPADTNQGMFAINTSSLPNGLYFIKVVCNGQMMTGRFVK